MQTEKIFLSGNNLTTISDVRYSEHVLIDSPGITEEEIANLASGTKVKSVSNLYRIDGKSTEFTILDRVVLKLKEDDPALLNVLISQYSLEKIERKWLGENVYLLRLSNSTKQTVLEVSKQDIRKRISRIFPP